MTEACDNLKNKINQQEKLIISMRETIKIKDGIIKNLQETMNNQISV